MRATYLSAPKLEGLATGGGQQGNGRSARQTRDGQRLTAARGCSYKCLPAELVACKAELSRAVVQTHRVARTERTGPGDGRYRQRVNERCGVVRAECQVGGGERTHRGHAGRDVEAGTACSRAGGDADKPDQACQYQQGRRLAAALERE